MNIDVTRLLRRDRLVDQATGLAVGMAVAALTVIVSELSNATNEEVLSGAFWLAIVSTAARSALTAVATALGLTIRGVSDGS